MNMQNMPTINSPAGNQTLVREGQTEVKSIWTHVSKCMFGALWLPDQRQIFFPSWKGKSCAGKSASTILTSYPYITYTLKLRRPIRAAPSRPNAGITANCTAQAARAACNTAWLPLQQVDFLHLQCTKHNYLVIFLNGKMNLNYWSTKCLLHKGLQRPSLPHPENSSALF